MIDQITGLARKAAIYNALRDYGKDNNAHSLQTNIEAANKISGYVDCLETWEQTLEQKEGKGVQISTAAVDMCQLDGGHTGLE